MKEHGLLCTASVALALHEGRQTQDRRPMKTQPVFDAGWVGIGAGIILARGEFMRFWHDKYGDDKPWRWVYDLDNVSK